MTFDDHIKQADRVIERTDALLSGHQNQASNLSDHAKQAVHLMSASIPVLTEVVEDERASATVAHFEQNNAAAKNFKQTEPATLIEHLIGIEAEVAREIDRWLQQELPELIEREVHAFSARLHEQISAHARSTLASTLSERIAAHLKTPPQNTQS